MPNQLERCQICKDFTTLKFAKYRMPNQITFKQSFFRKHPQRFSTRCQRPTSNVPRSAHPPPPTQVTEQSPREDPGSKAGGPSSSQHNRILCLEMSGPNPTSSAPADAPRFMHMTAAAAGTKAVKGIPVAEQLGGLWASTTVLTSVEDDLMQVIEPAADLGRGVLADLQGQHTPEPRVRGVFESEDTVVLSAPQ